MKAEAARQPIENLELLDRRAPGARVQAIGRPVLRLRQRGGRHQFRVHFGQRRLVHAVSERGGLPFVDAVLEFADPAGRAVRRFP